MAFDHDRPATGPYLLGGAGHGRYARHDVVAVDGHVVDAVAGGALFERCRVLGLDRGELGIAVVLAPEHDGEVPHSGQVHRLVERSLGYGAVAEERDGQAAIGPELVGGGGPGGDGEAGADDAVGPEDAEGRIGDVHRPAPTPVRPRVAGHQLGEHPLRVEALGQAVAVAPVRRGDDVVGPQRPARADRRGLLARRQVHEARDLTRLVHGRDPILEAPDHQHPPVQFQTVGDGEVGHEAMPFRNTSAWRAAISDAPRSPSGRSQR